MVEFPENTQSRSYFGELTKINSSNIHTTGKNQLNRNPLEKCQTQMLPQNKGDHFNK